MSEHTDDIKEALELGYKRGLLRAAEIADGHFIELEDMGYKTERAFNDGVRAVLEAIKAEAGRGEVGK